MSAAGDPARLIAPGLCAPRVVDIELTSYCNLHCRSCYYHDHPTDNYRDLPTEEWLSFFVELGRCAVRRVDVGGGEPFMRRDLIVLLEALSQQHIAFTLLSNGGLIDNQLAAAIAATGYCEQVRIWLEGSRPETHDRYRGRGAFFGALHGISTLRRHGVPVSVSVLLHHHNVHDLFELALLLLEELELPAFETTIPGEIDACRLDEEGARLTTDDRQLAVATLLYLSERYPGRVTALAGPLADALVWRRMEEARMAQGAALPGGGRLSGCHCVEDALAVRSDGVLVPCHLLAQTELGRINRDVLLDIWQQHPLLLDLRRRREMPLSAFAFCSGCSYRSYCTGGCPAGARANTSQLDQPNPASCLRRYLAEGGSLASAAGEELTQVK